MTLTTYEKQAIIEIESWKTPKEKWYSGALKVANKPFELAGDAIVNAPFVGDVLAKTTHGLVTALNDVAHATLRYEAIFKDFQKAGHQVSSLEDIKRLDLSSVDLEAGKLEKKYKALLLAEGATTGAMGAPGLILDVPLLLTGCFRAIGEYATHYGYNLQYQHERLFALDVLSLVASPTDLGKAAAMMQLTKTANLIARNITLDQMTDIAFVQIVQKAAQALGKEVTEQKMAEIIPLIGGVIGAGFNANFAHRVCTAAYHLYRERFIRDKHGLPAS